VVFGVRTPKTIILLAPLVNCVVSFVNGFLDRNFRGYNLLKLILQLSVSSSVKSYLAEHVKCTLFLHLIDLFDVLWKEAELYTARLIISNI
jgi:hypothetical protein